MNLILIDADELNDAGLVRVDGDRARHMTRVLRVALGQDVRLGVIDGPLGRGHVVAIDDDAVNLQCVFGEVPSASPVDLLLALPRPKVLRRLWAQFAALGVGRVMLTNAHRVERDYFDTHLLDPRGYRPLLLEGLQQARDTRVPVVSVHKQFRVLVEDHLDALVGDARRLVADPAAAASISQVVHASGEVMPTSDQAVRTPRDHRVLIAVGPEGGWNGFELDLLRAHGFSSVSMGPRTLRLDTAAVALLALVHDALRSTPAPHQQPHPRQAGDRSAAG